MPLLTVANLRTSPIAFQTDGQAFVSFTVLGSTTMTDKVITVSQAAALEAQLRAAATAGHVTWYVKDDPASSLDNPAGSVATAKSGAGAVDITARTTLFTSTGGAQAVTLADGTYIGQRKTIVHHVDGGSCVITPAHTVGFATITLTNRWESVELEWNGTGWVVVMASPVAIVA